MEGVAWAPSSTRERLARRVVGPVDVLVAVDAAAADQPVAAGLQRHTVVDRRRMPRSDMTALAQHRRPRHEHLLGRRAVRVVAGDAALATGGVLEQEGAALLGVARHAA